VDDFRLDRHRPVCGWQRPGGQPTAANFAFGSDTVNLYNPTRRLLPRLLPPRLLERHSIFKEFKMPWFTSKLKLQLRLEAFNLFNHQLHVPSLTLTSARLGVTSSANANRQIQLGAKFIF
jgi:uncharacterized protein involved in outer membrane biogenesis